MTRSTTAEESGVTGTAQAESTRRAPAYVGSLDGIRALAVTAVFLYHTAIHSLPGGFLGVSTFFTLSGFLITTLLLREGDHDHTIRLRSFWARRVRRLAPAMFLNVAMVLTLTVLVPSAWPRVGLGGDTVSVFFSVFNWRIIDAGGQSVIRFLSPYSPLWSLSLEEQFYVVFPLAVLAVVALGGSRRALAWVCGAGVLASVLISVFYSPAASFGPSAPLMEQFRTDVRMGEILVGSLLALAIPTWKVVNARWADALGWAALVVTLIVWQVGRERQEWLVNGGLVLLAVVSAALVYGALAGGTFARVLSLPPLRYLGQISYGVYLYHWPIFLATRDIAYADNRPALFLTRVVLTLGVAALSFHFVETPIRRGRALRAPYLTIVWIVATLGLSAAAFAVAT